MAKGDNVVVSCPHCGKPGSYKFAATTSTRSMPAGSARRTFTSASPAARSVTYDDKGEPGGCTWTFLHDPRPSTNGCWLFPRDRHDS